MSGGHAQASDRGAAFTGLIVGAVVLLIMVLAIVAFTNRQFAGHSAQAAATSTK